MMSVGELGGNASLLESRKESRTRRKENVPGGKNGDVDVLEDRSVFEDHVMLSELLDSALSRLKLDLKKSCNW